MKKKVLVIQHVTRARPGFIFDILESECILYDRVDLAKGESILDLNSYSAMVMLGSTESVNDNSLGIRKAMLALKTWLPMHRPYLGICLGMQMLIKAAGGSIVRSPHKEIGFRDHEGCFFEIALTESGKKDQVFVGLDERIEVFQCHEDTIEITPQVKILATGKHVHHQAVKVGDVAYGIQGHFELTREMLDIWRAEHPDLQRVNQDELIDDFTNLEEKHTMSGSRIFKNFLSIVKGS